MSLNTAVDHPHTEPVPTALRAAMAPGVLAGSTVLTDAFLRVTLVVGRRWLDPEVAAAYRAPYVSRLGRGGIGGFVADIPQWGGTPLPRRSSAGFRRSAVLGIPHAAAREDPVSATAI